MRVDTRLSRVMTFLLPAAFVATISLIVNVAFLNRGFEHFGVLAVASGFTGITADS